MGFLEDYEPVEDRLRKFWERHPSGQVVTELLDHSDGTYIVAASIYRGDELRDGRPAATGLAREVETERGVNATSALENCETSAIGRALANLGFAPKGKRPSREEMRKAKAVTEVDGAVPDSMGVGGRGAPKASVATVEAAPLRTGGTEPDGSKTEASGLSVAASAPSEPVSAKLTGSAEGEVGSEAYGEGVTGPTTPKPAHPGPHVWAQSPKLAKFEICTIGACMETRRKTSVSA